MTVYVDGMRAAYGRMKMCHMVADTPAELHAMAAKLGVRRWFQNDASTPHYDICLSKRAEAVKLGAVEIDRYHLGKLLPTIRKNWPVKEGRWL